MACFSAVIEAGCQHQAIIVGDRNPKTCQNTFGSTRYWEISRPAFGGAYHAFGFAKYASCYLAAFAYRFNRRFQLDTSRCVFFSWPPPLPLGLVQILGFCPLKQLANQEIK
jgi:hypothetical protein